MHLATNKLLDMSGAEQHDGKGLPARQRQHANAQLSCLVFMFSAVIEPVSTCLLAWYRVLPAALVTE